MLMLMPAGTCAATYPERGHLSFVSQPACDAYADACRNLSWNLPRPRPPLARLATRMRCLGWNMPEPVLGPAQTAATSHALSPLACDAYAGTCQNLCWNLPRTRPPLLRSRHSFAMSHTRTSRVLWHQTRQPIMLWEQKQTRIGYGLTQTGTYWWFVFAGILHPRAPRRRAHCCKRPS